MITARVYNATDATAWNDFVASSKNGTFILDRRYMDYHAERYVDHSLLFFDEGGQLTALLPAHREGEILASHAGLTYGGVITSCAMSASRMLDVFDATLSHMRAAGLTCLRYKTIPHIYHHVPAEEDRYALFRHGATVVRVDVLSVLALPARLPWQERRKRGARSAARLGLTTSRSNDLAAFWGVLEDNLRTRHGVRPAHSLEEMSLLRDRFPERITLHVCRHGDVLLAGVLVYLAGPVAHAQYIASTEDGKRMCALDFLFERLIADECRGQAYFDFGASTEDAGRTLNAGLVGQKEGFGARTVAHEMYEVHVS